jgi:hypothetical protein
MKTLSFSCIASVALGLVTVARADEVRLASGGTLSGVVRQESDWVTVEVAAGTVTVPASQVTEIERKRHPLHEYYERLSGLGSSPGVNDLVALASWADKQGFGRFARELSTRVLAKDQEQEGAHKLLGHERRDGRWLTSAEVKAADGLVSFRGRWIPREERDRILREEEDARQAALDRSEERRRQEEERRRAAGERTGQTQETLVMGIGSTGEPYHRNYTRSRYGGRRGGHIRGFGGHSRPGTTIRR